MKKKVYLITGAAGFIGFHLSKELLNKNCEVIGIDNLNDYYDTKLKMSRLEVLNKYKNFTFEKIDIKEKNKIDTIFEKYSPEFVVNLAAQAGVRHSIENPYAYVDSNLIGFINILEACRQYPVKHLLYASSSSVYGGNSKVPFSTDDNVDHPVSLYAATKKSNELLAHSYSHLYGIPTTGLRFFTVYGPFGRPDMAYFSFTKNIFEGKSIKVFNEGKMERDFTYIDDIVEAVSKLIDIIPEKNDSWTEDLGINSSFAPYKVYNIGNNQPESLMKFINILENKIGTEADKELVGMQNGDVKRTYADTSDLERTINFKPQTSLDYGLEKFVEWYKDYYEEGN
ncbi:NAD-dependent epimerase [Vagococcus carniphilus]|uniref:NAD-dependent epimerase n=1 Tax=Vagococcus carniphilus TaxID=218144 RepID=UPI00288D0134|nr:NAD-dependent epimerase [Vagococcus carniphilus]MDT2865741.1 NAD-dependent epimerase [Vagococcus carniphilus]